jgi:predicted RNase H-like HicB family nuclease
MSTGASAYEVVVEGDAESNFSAYIPGVPGVVATGSTEAECRTNMQGAVALHVEAQAGAIAEIIRELAATDPVVKFQNGACKFCGVWLGLPREDHEPECLHVRAKAAMLSVDEERVPATESTRS